MKWRAILLKEGCVGKQPKSQPMRHSLSPFNSCSVTPSDTAEEVLPANKSVSEFHFVCVDLFVFVCLFVCLCVFVFVPVFVSVLCCVCVCVCVCVLLRVCLFV